MYNKNKVLRELSAEINGYTIELNNTRADQQVATAALESLKESHADFQAKLTASVEEQILEKTKDHPDQGVLLPATDGNYQTVRITSQGMLLDSLAGYNNFTFEKKIFDKNKITISDKGVGTDSTKVYVVLDEFGFAKQINIPNGLLSNTGNVIYLTYRYCPGSMYRVACDRIEKQIADTELKIPVLEKEIKTIEDILKEK
jgi:hypothetical protein